MLRAEHYRSGFAGDEGVLMRVADHWLKRVLGILIIVTATGSARSAGAKTLGQAWATLSEATTCLYYRGNVRSHLTQFVATARLPELARKARPIPRKAAQGAIDIIGKQIVAEQERAMAKFTPATERERLNRLIREGVSDPNNADNAYYQHFAQTAKNINEWAMAQHEINVLTATLQAHWRAEVLPAIIAAAGPETAKPVIEVKTERLMKGIWCSATNVSGQTLTNCTMNFVVDEGLVAGILGQCALRLIPSLKDVSAIPTEGKGLIIVAAVDHVLHLRIFNTAGKIVVDTDEKRLPEHAQPIENLRKQLDSRRLSQAVILTENEKLQAIAAVTSIVGHTLEGVYVPIDRSWFVREWPAGEVIYPEVFDGWCTVPPGKESANLESLAIDFQIWCDQHRTSRQTAKVVQPYTIHTPFIGLLLGKGTKYVNSSGSTRTTLEFQGNVRSKRREWIVQAVIRTESVDGKHRPAKQLYRAVWSPNLGFPSVVYLNLIPPPVPGRRAEILSFKWSEGEFLLNGMAMTPLPGEPEKEHPATPTPDSKLPTKSQDPAARATMLLKLADNLENSGNVDGALEYYREIKKEHPGSAQAKTAGERIKAITGK
jgi:hypothetical protein